MEKQEFSSHISEMLNRNLEDLFNHILEMGGMVERQFETALVALGSGDTEKAVEIIAFDKAINKAEMKSTVCARKYWRASNRRLPICV